MPDSAIQVRNLGKHYRIGTRLRGGQPLLRELASGFLRAPAKKLASLIRPRRDAEHIWALRNVSFDVPRGQILGIIGPNGAGKSTLLKILSRITEPTEGRAEIRGRVGSLLEVGTGFHPELTGRENIYLSGALLGMKKAETDRKLDEIIAFSEIEKFVDTPVKRYSSGMYVRLAFAVAAHLEPDILIVDEVLAVGDVTFQRKCLSKMEDVRQHGRTVLFVSHNMEAVTRLCQRALLISGGRIQKDGHSADVASAYLLTSLGTTAARSWPDPARAPGDSVARLLSVRVADEHGVTADTIDIRQPVTVEMVYDILESGHHLWPYFVFFNEGGLCVFGTLDHDPEWRNRSRPPGRYASSVCVPGNFLAEGALLVGAAMSSDHPFRIHFFERDVLGFHVRDSADGDTARGTWDGDFPGAVRPLLPWTTSMRD